MAVYQFYMNPSGNNCNAGSTAADAGGSDSPSVTETNGSWNSTTRVFTAASGTPFSGVSAGEWASITTDGATTTTYVGMVSSVGGGGASVTLDASVNIPASAPSTNATGRTCRIGGAWASPALFTSLLGTGAATLIALDVNIKAATYANTTTSRTININPSTSGNRVALVGYSSAPGDMDAQPAAGTSRVSARDGGTDIPSITFTSGVLAVNSQKLTLRNLDILSTSTGNAAVVVSASYFEMDRCRAENTGANAASHAISLSSTSFKLASSSFKANALATQVVNAAGSAGLIIGNTVRGGSVGIMNSSDGLAVISNVIEGTASHGLQTSTRAHVVGNSFISIGGNGVHHTNGATGASVINSAFRNCGGYDINVSSGDAGGLFLSNNSTFGATSGHTNSMSDLVQRLVTEGSDPFPTGEPPLASGAGSLNAGMPGQYENEDFASEVHIGFQNVPAGGSGGGATQLINGGLVS